MKKTLSVFLIIYLLSALPLFCWEENLLTRPEKSNYNETSRYEEVVMFFETLQQKSDNIRVSSIGKSAEGRDIPLVIMGDPLPASPALAAIQGKPSIYIQANIHAGEVEGKEAMMMLAREILLGELNYLLDKQIILLTPIFNPDGNEKINPRNRRNQVGPDSGVGVRHNGQNLDLNRDYIKIESPENNGAIRYILNRWDPMLLIDLHTTNGSYHQEPLTYATAHNPNGNEEIPRYMREKLFPKVAKKLASKYNILSIPYGYFADSSEPTKGWRTFNHQPFYSTNYWGLRNRFAVLNENYAYADFETRVRACYHFVELILEYSNKHTAEMKQLIQKVDQETVLRGKSAHMSKKFATKIEATPFEKDLLIRSYEFEFYEDARGRKRAKKTDRLKNYHVPFYGKFVSTESVSLPKGYFISENKKEIADKLLQHGIIVEQLTESVELKVTSFQVEKIENSQRMYQGHLTTKISGIYKSGERKIKAGTYFVGMDQPLADLAAYLLEPESDGGLVYWNFFDRYLRVSQWSRSLNEFPVLRLMQPKYFARKCVEKF